MAYQRAYLPMKTINLSQGYGKNSYSHKTGYPLDFAGKDGGKDDFYAPFDCKVVKLYQPKDTKAHATTVWIKSTKKVLCTNGYYGYLVMMIVHPNEIMNMKLNQTFKQGDFFCKEGMTGKATGNHIHMELSNNVDKIGWDKNYNILNPVKPEEYLFAYDDATIKNNKYQGIIYNFKKEKDMLYDVKDDVYAHSSADFEEKTRIGEFKKGHQAIVFGSKNKSYYAYSWSVLGYASKNYLKKSQ